MTRIFKNSRHIRWNWEPSPDTDNYGRFQIIIVNDKNRRGIMNKFLEQLQQVPGIIIIRKNIEAKVKESKYRYLFETYDSPIALKEIKWEKIGDKIKRDTNLYERQKGSIEDYVARMYEK
ncbi:hypothetical protein CMI39_02265 [Candidatus Pacearchaeota archaeon]|jgi:endonuclease III|nr:hypothetical protein [Candidatus Pacearchaeota archaeon]|tara:strand:+ start:21331 stop:21690 length:360 start_codon:yes stop_codon:yes gene_type:complete